jgi:hypothetical protein
MKDRRVHHERAESGAVVLELRGIGQSIDGWDDQANVSHEIKP